MNAAPPMNDLQHAVARAVGRVMDPEIRKPIGELNMISGVSVTDAGEARIGVKLTIVGCPAADTIERNVRNAAALVPGVTAVQVDVAVMSKEERQALTEKLRGPGSRSSQFGTDSLTRIYAITSGKGGVGKSTLTANLGVLLAARGLSVGIIDADVFGFSIPGLLGLVDDPEHPAEGAGEPQPEPEPVHKGPTNNRLRDLQRSAVHSVRPTRVGDLILPPIAYDVKVISIGMFLDPEKTSQQPTAVAWRGPMLHRTVQQFITEVHFGALDVLLLDLPPGTGDVAISIGQLLPNAQVIVVTTPQPAAADIAERSGALARSSGQRIVGVIENMSGLAQTDGTVLELFGSGGGAETARRLSTEDEPVPVLGSVPLSVGLREGGDAGQPVVLAHPDDPASVAIAAIADRLLELGRARTPPQNSGNPAHHGAES